MALETGLPPRYVIRTLDISHLEWSCAIFIHSHMFHGLLKQIIKENRIAKTYEGFRTADYLIRYQLESGYSLGVFDTEYQFKRPESAAAGGKLWWNLKDESVDSETLLEQMDFPLVSIAMAYDSINPFDREKLKSLAEFFPPFFPVMATLATLDKREPESWVATGPGQVLFRNATNTRHDYEGKGIMANTARFMMRQSAERGFRGIQIQSVSDGVAHVWSNPPPPFKGEVIAAFNTQDYEQKVENGQTENPFGAAKQTIRKCFVTLK